MKDLDLNSQRRGISAIAPDLPLCDLARRQLSMHEVDLCIDVVVRHRDLGHAVDKSDGST